MRFTVSWDEAAEQSLAELFLDAGDRFEIRAAADWIDENLQTQPDRIGHYVHEGLLGLQRSPLKVLYSLSLEDRLVEVLGVARSR